MSIGCKALDNAHLCWAPCLLQLSSACGQRGVINWLSLAQPLRECCCCKGGDAIILAGGRGCSVCAGLSMGGQSLLVQATPQAAARPAHGMPGHLAMQEHAGFRMCLQNRNQDECGLLYCVVSNEAHGPAY